jgi:hypothetical protein
LQLGAQRVKLFFLKFFSPLVFIFCLLLTLINLIFKTY